MAAASQNLFNVTKKAAIDMKNLVSFPFPFFAYFSVKGKIIPQQNFPNNVDIYTPYLIYKKSS